MRIERKSCPVPAMTEALRLIKAGRLPEAEIELHKAVLQAREVVHQQRHEDTRDLVAGVLGVKP